MQDENKNNFSKYMANPKSFTLKRWFSELLKNNYANHDQIVERVSASLLTDRDLRDFGSLMTQVYEQGYRKAVDDYKKEVEKLGIKVTVGPSERNQD